MVYKRIINRKTDSVNSVEQKADIDIELYQHTKLSPFGSVFDTISQMEVFEEERENCDKYRLILTINPFCTNILFNTVTEIISPSGEVVTNERSISGEINGKNSDVTPYDFVRNTEYSKESVGYEYHCGYDIFNNHILRNKTFKVVNKLKNGVSNDEKFNTIEDTMRYGNGEDVPYISRRSINETEYHPNGRHLYFKDEIMDFTDSINNNLREENGWYGFMNTSNIDTDNDLDIGHVINTAENCDFIDMYPDRSLFLFNPKYDEKNNKELYNWDICLTYPYDSDDNSELLKSTDGLNALLVENIDYTMGISGNKVLMFKTYINHGLQPNDTIHLYTDILQTGNFNQIGGSWTILSVGNLNQDDEEHYFILRESEMIFDTLSEIKEGYRVSDNNSNQQNVELTDEEKSEMLNTMEFRFKRVVNNMESEYYFRKFKKLPNLAKRGVENFTKETYPLAFANTIYNDPCTQITFTDDIDLDSITDNRGRPLTEIFVTIIKRNNDNEFSRCFGKVDAGIKIGHIENADEEKKYKYASLSDVQMLNNLNCYEPKDLQEEITLESEDYYGDIVEFNKYEAVEHVLEDVCFRFNTKQRESGTVMTDNNEICDDSSLKNEIFKIDEIESDDLDANGFEVKTHGGNCLNLDDEGNLPMAGGIELEVHQRPEGYYYKAHYKIDVRELGDITQGSYKSLDVKSAKIVNVVDNIFLELTTRLPHNLAGGDVIIFTDLCSNHGIQYTTTVADVISKTKFTIFPLKEINWVRLCAWINDSAQKTLYIQKFDNDIPDYASSIEGNAYLWRSVLKPGSGGTRLLKEYPFANGCFYVNKEINFFLHRQDPFGKNGLYKTEMFPNDVFGVTMKTSNYEYKTAEKEPC